jgi:hypothetical protein
MTPEQLERAARHYCKLMGVDPEQVIMDEAAFYVPRWIKAAQDLKTQWAMNEALKEGMRDPFREQVMKDMLGDTA